MLNAHIVYTLLRIVTYTSIYICLLKDLTIDTTLLSREVFFNGPLETQCHITSS